MAEIVDQFLKEVGDIVAPKDEDEYDDETAAAIHPYEQLEKAAVLQEARIFHDSILVKENPRKCCRILAQILYLQNDAKATGAFSKLTIDEATELFFASTKLFVDVEDASLRRLVYLFIKEIQPLCDPSDVIIVTSCLTKDMTCDVGLYRANAIRVLVHIIDSAMLGSIERYIKQAILDNDSYVSNSALASASHLFTQSTENATIVRRWVGEVQEMMIKRSGKEANPMVQANSMRLLCQMKSRDRLGMAKILQQFSAKAGSTIQSPIAIVILIRLAGKLLIEEVTNLGHNGGGDVRSISSLSKLCFDFLDTSLQHPNNMISYEAARTICLIPNIGVHELSRSMECFRSMLFDDKPSVRYAAVKTLSNVAQPRAVALCNEGLEALLTDDSKQIATLAVSTLLKTGSEATIDKVLGMLSSVMDGIQDDQKIAILKSLEHLCLSYPSKHRAIIIFLSTVLREDEGFDFKRSIVNSIVSLIKKVPETTDSSLLLLCEFIEDCEYAMLSTHIMHIVADLATTSTPSRYIPSIYNRVILENATVRSAAIAALTKFAARCPSLRSSITARLKHCLHDEDDETRDRASVAVSVLEEAMAANPYVAPNEEEYNETIVDEPVEGDIAATVYLQPLPMSFKSLEHSIKSYMSTPGAMDSNEELTFSTLPIVEEIEEPEPDNTVDEVAGTLAETKIRDPAAAIYAIPEFAEFGRVFRSSPVVSLTEEETEYVVRCIKHILDEHIILQFIIQNTVDDTQMQNVTIELESDSDAYEIIGDVAMGSIKYGETASAYTVIQRQAVGAKEPAAEFISQLNFLSVQVDPDSGEALDDGYDEEYPLENLIITASDFMAKVGVPDFRKAWNGTSDNIEALGQFVIPSKSLAQAVKYLVELLGMQPCDGTGSPPNSESKPHMLHLSGVFVGGHEVLARAQLAVKKGEGTMLKIAVRSNDEAVSENVLSCIN